MEKPRREWDLNPRGPYGPTGFRDLRLQPLGHLSNILSFRNLRSRYPESSTLYSYFRLGLDCRFRGNDECLDWILYIFSYATAFCAWFYPTPYRRFWTVGARQWPADLVLDSHCLAGEPRVKENEWQALFFIA